MTVPIYNAMIPQEFSSAGTDPEFGKGGCTLLKKLKTKKKGRTNNGCPLPNVYTIKYINSFIVKLHCLMNTVTALLE